jgi:phosphopantothenoylcysteine decarboxylase/phosphopantothenate--cysteine ligase
MLKSKILFQLTGSISCFKAAQAISTLVQNGHEVKCVATKNALQFIGAATLEGLTGSQVFSDTFQSTQMMDHIHLARWADVFVLCPATANTINKLANGVADDVIGQLFLAKGSDKPYLIFPAMNHEMFSHPATQKSTVTLTGWGIKIAPTGIGHQACGETGLGRLLEPTEIVALIEGKKTGLKILVTAGATREPIDDVRFISNVSTGATAATLSDYFLTEGHDVTYLAGQGTVTPKLPVQVDRFTDFLSLFDLLKKELLTTKYDMVLHAAAVSDYSPAAASAGKINSDISDFTLSLKRNKKIVSEIKKWSPSSILVAFKLTSGASDTEITDAVQKLLIDSKPDLIVHNDLSQMKFNDERVFTLFSKLKSKSFETKSLKELGQFVLERSVPSDLSS